VSRLQLRLVIGIVVLLVALTAVDRAAVSLVSWKAAQGLQSVRRLPQAPEVSFEGVPFLTQVAQGSYRQVHVVMTDVPTSEGVRVDRLDVTLHGVHAGTLPALRGKLKQVFVEHVDADAATSFISLEQAAGQMIGLGDLQLRLGRVAEDRVEFTAQVRMLTGMRTVRGQAQVAVQEGAVVLKLLPQTITGVPEPFRSEVDKRLNLNHLVPALPFGLRATSVTVTPTGLNLQATGTKLSIPVQAGGGQ
jgi:hypothetical protein